MSFYADYLKERTNDNILETEYGFVTYRYLNEKQVYIIDIYVDPLHRKQGIAAKMATAIAMEAKSLGCSEMLGTVIASTKGAKESLLILFAYGMDLSKIENNIIILKKDI